MGARWRSWPWAAVVAMAIILLVDRTVLGVSGPWEWVHSRIGQAGSVYEGVARDRAVLASLAAEQGDEQRVFIMGSSRARRGHRSIQAEVALPEVRFAVIAHAMMDLLTIRMLVPEVVAARADGVVLVISEFDTHRPLRFDPLPARSGAMPSAFLEVASEVGPRFGWENRGSFLRLATARALNAYRFRESLGAAGLDRFRRFQLADRLRGSGTVEGLQAPAVLGEGLTDPLNEATEDHIRALIGPEMQRHFGQVYWMAETHRGEHAAVQMHIVRRTVHELVRAGVWVVIVEAPLHPIAKRLQMREARAEFLQFAHELERHEDVRFVPLSAQAPFERTDFVDLLHLDLEGSTRMTTAVLDVVAEQIER